MKDFTLRELIARLKKKKIIFPEDEPEGDFTLRQLIRDLHKQGEKP